MSTYTINLNDVVLSVNGNTPDGSGNVSITIPNTIYTSDDSLTSNRTLNGDGYSLEFSDIDSFTVTTGGTVFGDQDYVFSTASGVSQVIYGDRSTRFYNSMGIGDAPQSNIRLQVYGSGKDVGINVEATNSASKGLVATSSGANGKGGQFTCQAGGGIGLSALGDAIGIEGKVTGSSGTALTINGKGVIQDYNTFNARASCAVLDINSTTGGLLLPRMTTAQRTAISSPIGGLIVFDTDLSSFMAYDGTSWKTVVLI
tara:strand:+ start:676 stop:1446 length:771 start_codon:yes stop_codon:yes gene_type:complete